MHTTMVPVQVKTLKIQTRSTSFKTRRTQKTSSALEDFICVVFIPDRNIGESNINTAVDSCETTKEIWEHVRQMKKGSNIGEHEKKAKLFNEWEKFTSTDGESIE
ncbi:hypothetical protein Tco_0225305, partial [Tanacetum coccineum]